MTLIFQIFILEAVDINNTNSLAVVEMNEMWGRISRIGGVPYYNVCVKSVERE